MKHFFYAVLFVSLLLSVNCNRESDILATCKDESITRGEFYKWIEAKHFVKDSVLKAKKKQKNKLRMMMIEGLAVKRARNEGFDKADNFKNLANLAKESQLMRVLYDKEIKAKTNFTEKAVKIKHILFRVKDYKVEKNKRVMLSKADIEKNSSKVMVKVKEVLQKLEKGEKFEELAKKYSDDFSKKKGGEIGYILRDMMPAEYSDVAFSLGEGEYTKEPVKLSKGIYIIKVEEKAELTEKNIDDVLENKAQASKIKSKIIRQHANDYVNKLMNAEDVKKSFDKVSSKNKKDILFNVGEMAFTVQDLDERVELYMGKSMGASNRKSVKVTDDQKRGLLKNIFKFEVLKRVAISKGLDKDPKYLQEMSAKVNSILSREYMKKVGETEVVITKEEMKAEYNKNKDRRYYKMVTKNKKREKKVEPFSKVKDRITKVLQNRKRSEKIRLWKDELLKECGFKVEEAKLEGE